MSFQIKIIFSFSALIAIWFSGCSKDIGYPEPKVTCDTTGNITYTNFVSNVMSSNCTFSGCHDSGSSIDLSSYATVKLKIDDGSFYQRVLVQKDMPPSYSSGPLKMDDCTLGKLKKWINNGAPQ